MSNLSRILRNEANPIWEKIFNHPFLVEMAEGRLPLSKFKFYIKQDHAYLRDFCKFLGIAIARTDALERMRWLSTLLRATIIVEMGMQRKLASKIGLSMAELKATRPSPTALAYSSYMIRVASTGSFDEIVAVMSPCPLSYVEIGERMISSKGLEREPVYKEWCSLYASPQAKKLAERLKYLIDRIGEKASHEEEEKIKEHFIIASKYEYMFWDMAYKLEEWPI